MSYATTRTIGPLIIAGILRSRWDLIELGAFVSDHMREAMLEGKALRFIYPERDLDFSIYIQAISEIGIDMSQGEIVPYMLTCSVTQDHTQLTPTDISALGALPENVEWIDVATAAQIAEQRFPQLFGDSSFGLPEGSEPGDTAEPGSDTPPEEEETGQPSNDPTSSGIPFTGDGSFGR